MAKKMCPHWKENLDVTCCPTIKSHDGKDVVCAGYYKTKPGCELIPKRKSKVRRVKAWISTGFFNCMAIAGIGTVSAVKRAGDIPCIIEVKEPHNAH